MEETLKKIGEIIEEYESGAFKTLIKLLAMRRGLSCCHYRLTVERVKYHNLFNVEANNHKGTSQAAKIAFAKREVPELYLCRHILTSVKLVLDSMQQEISVMNKDN